MKSLILSLALVTTALPAFAVAPAMAQSAGEAVEEGNDIVVTARRRAELALQLA